jgi:hypothetical protein
LVKSEIEEDFGIDFDEHFAPELGVWLKWSETNWFHWMTGESK